jgi:segregation and condensation protein A
MQDYRVELDVYHGPLDLLLYLIRRDEIDIHNIPVARITEQYLEHVKALRTIDINLAGEFLVMAATLMEIKSAMMSPREDQPGEQDVTGSGDGSGAGGDPRYELVQQLLAYKRFKDAAHALDRRRETFAARFPRKPGKLEKVGDEVKELDLEDASIWDLMEAFNRLMEQVGGPPRVEIVADDTPLELHAADIVDRLEREGAMTLQKMFDGRRAGEMLGLFLAMLELIRHQKVRAEQTAIAGEIQLRAVPRDQWIDPEAIEARPAVKFDPSNPDHFDWPDEETRRRYARRMERRARGEKIEEDEELEEDLKAIEAAQTVTLPRTDAADVPGQGPV